MVQRITFSNIIKGGKYMSLFAGYQNRVIGPNEVINYSDIIRQFCPAVSIQMEQFVGFKILCRDMNAHLIPSDIRFKQIESNLGFLVNTGCIIREAHPNDSFFEAGGQRIGNGFWVVTFPVPKRQMSQQLASLNDVLTTLSNVFGIVPSGLLEINVSGRCFPHETEGKLSSLILPSTSCMGYVPVAPANTPYKFGSVVRISNEYMCFRTRWRNDANGSPSKISTEDLAVITQLVSSIYN